EEAAGATGRVDDHRLLERPPRRGVAVEGDGRQGPGEATGGVHDTGGSGAAPQRAVGSPHDPRELFGEVHEVLGIVPARAGADAIVELGGQRGPGRTRSARRRRHDIVHREHARPGYPARYTGPMELPDETL